MRLERLFLFATVLIMLVNIVGWEVIRRYFRVARRKRTTLRDITFITRVLPWVTRLEFIYYLALAFLVIVRPGIFPLAVVLSLVLYHAAGFVLGERHKFPGDRQTAAASSTDSSSSRQLLFLRIISFLDGFEMALLIYFCLILNQRS